MCGFTGLHLNRSCVADRSEAEILSVVRSMTATLRLRGPDGEGLHLADPVALGHRRLSILDLSETGSQPMQLRPGGPVIAYNGEAYNFAGLRRELEALGQVFRGRSDTEVVLRAYEAWGLDGLKRLEGIFAFALWDPRARRLVLMRDRLGVKPLYYAPSRWGLAFGSEIKAVLAAGGVDETLDDQAFAEYLWFGNTHGERTFFRGVRSLPPGHWLLVEDGQMRREPWWRIEDWLDHPMASGDHAHAAELLRERVDEAVRRQLVADVPVGLFLSGGVDSSAIAASAAHVRAEPLLSFAAGFDFDRGVNELPKAASVARHLGLAHQELRVVGADLPQALSALVAAHDEPFADAANVPLFMMCKALAGRVKVVLQGDGGDELFAGYRRYALLRHAAWARRWPGAMTSAVRMAGAGGARAARLLDALGQCDPALRMAALLTVEVPGAPPTAMLEPERAHQLATTTDPFIAYREAAQRFAGHDPVQQMLLTDLTVQLPSQFLPKVDRATMAAGVEARVPLLDERVAELAVKMPVAWKVGAGGRKIVLRDAFRGRLPASILDGPKTGFGVPFGQWIREPLYAFARERLLDRRTLGAFSLRPAAVERALEEHRAGRRDHGFRLWKLLQLALWQEHRR